MCWGEHFNNKLASCQGEGVEDKVFEIGEFKMVALGQPGSGCASLSSRGVGNEK